MNIITHDWNGHAIAQVKEQASIAKFCVPAGYVNATQMCQANGKQWADYKKLKSSKAYWEALAADMNIPLSDLVVEIIGGGYGDDQGTWVHLEIAVDIAQWISVSFKVWANRNLTKLVLGEAVVPQSMSTADLLLMYAQAFKEHEERLAAIEQENQEIKHQLEAIDMETVANTAELERFRNGHGFWMSIAGWCSNHGIKKPFQWMNVQGRKASALCKAKGIQPVKVTDPRFGTVNTYPDSVLAELLWD